MAKTSFEKNCFSAWASTQGSVLSQFSVQQSKCCIYIFSPKRFKLSNIRIIFSFEARGGGGGGGRGGSNSTILFHLTFLCSKLSLNTQGS